VCPEKTNLLLGLIWQKKDSTKSDRELEWDGRCWQSTSLRGIRWVSLRDSTGGGCSWVDPGDRTLPLWGRQTQRWRRIGWWHARPLPDESSTVHDCPTLLTSNLRRTCAPPLVSGPAMDQPINQKMNEWMQWRRHTRWVGCVHTPCQENT